MAKRAIQPSDRMPAAKPDDIERLRTERRIEEKVQSDRIRALNRGPVADHPSPHPAPAAAAAAAPRRTRSLLPWIMLLACLAAAALWFHLPAPMAEMAPGDAEAQRDVRAWIATGSLPPGIDCRVLDAERPLLHLEPVRRARWSRILAEAAAGPAPTVTTDPPARIECLVADGRLYCEQGATTRVRIASPQPGGRSIGLVVHAKGLALPPLIGQIDASVSADTILARFAPGVASDLVLAGLNPECTVIGVSGAPGAYAHRLHLSASQSLVVVTRHLHAATELIVSPHPIIDIKVLDNKDLE